MKILICNSPFRYFIRSIHSISEPQTSKFALSSTSTLLNAIQSRHFSMDKPRGPRPMFHEGQYSEGRPTHETDKLDQTRWRLIYFNDAHEKLPESEWTVLFFATITTFSMIIATAFTVLVLPEIVFSGNRAASSTHGDQLLIASAVGYWIFYLALTRWMRLRVIRIYESMPTLEKKAALSIEKKEGGAGLFNRVLKDGAETADFCIVRKGVIAVQSKRFYFKQKEVSGAKERSAIATMFLGNFRARGRRWAVYKEYFPSSNDYDRVRGVRK